MASILVIDDEKSICELLSILLTTDGHEVAVAGTGTAGIALHCRQHYDLIITDMIMPDGDGMAVLAQLSKVYDTTPVIAMSGGRRKITDSPFNLAAALTMGVQVVLEKPFSATDLQNAVRKALKQ